MTKKPSAQPSKAFVKVTAYLHPKNIAFLKGVQRETRQCPSSFMNDAVTCLRRAFHGEHPW